MRIIIGLILMLLSSISFAEEYCTKVQSSGEGHWPIPEDEFNIENANTAIEELKKLISAYSPGSSITPDAVYLNEVENHQMMIKGYMLKSMLDKYIKKENNRTVTENMMEYHKSTVGYLKEEFCGFVKHDAYIRH